MTLRAEVMRLPLPAPFLTLLRGFRIVSPVDAALCTFALVYASKGASWPWLLLGVLVAPLSAYLSLRSLLFIGPGALRAMIMNARHLSLFRDVLAMAAVLYLTACVRRSAPWPSRTSRPIPLCRRQRPFRSSTRRRSVLPLCCTSKVRPVRACG